jgi:hypothetical protein
MVIEQKLPFGKASYLCTICGRETKIQDAIKECSEPEIIVISELTPNCLVNWNGQVYRVVDLNYAKGFERITDNHNNQEQKYHEQSEIVL